MSEPSPPHNLSAERAVLGALLLHPASLAVAQIDVRLTPEDFYSRQYANVYESICRIVDEGRGVDELTVSVDLQEHQQEAPADLNELVTHAPSAGNLRDYARFVRDQALRRRVLQQAYEIAQAARAPGDARELIEDAERRMLSIEDERVGQLLRLDAAEEQARIEALKDGAEPDQGVLSGLSDLDALTSGWRADNLVVVAARPGLGKSAFAGGLAKAAAESGIPVALFSLEMSRQEILRRLIAATARVPGDALMKGPLLPDRYKKVQDAIEKILSWPLYVDESPDLSVIEARAKARRLHAKHPLGLIVVDYLQLMRPEKAENRNVEVSQITRGLKVLAKELHVPVIAVSQLSRAVESRNDKHPLLSDLRDSGSVEQDADMVLLLYRESYYNDQADPGIAELQLAKHRNGPVGRIKLTFLERYPRFDNYENPDKWGTPSTGGMPF